MKITVDAPAKINIFLDIIGKLDNGYHSLFMVMQSVDLCDRVIAEQAESGIELTCSDERLPCDERNIAYKAADAFFKKTNIEPKVRIHIEKRIPFAAGLAGGSSDGAAVLVALNELFGNALSQRSLLEIGISIGSDIPFCILGGTMLAQNTGGVLSPLKPLKECFVVLSKPEKGVSTPKAYADADSAYIYHPDCMRMLDSCEKGDFDAICKYAGNVFEQVVEVPERVEIKGIMRKYGSPLCQMSGSGPTVFGLFDDEESALKCLFEVKKICPDSFIAKTCNHGAITVDRQG